MIQVGCSDITPKAIKYVTAVLKSGNLSYGLYTKRFESLFAEKHGAKHGIFMNSGTDALRIALATLKEYHGWKDGDEVIVPATTFVATVNIVLQNNLKPVFVDVDRLTFNIDDSLINNAITHRTKAIIPVHLFGLRSTGIPGMRYLKVIEDSCETMGVGPIQGDIACYSTYMAHLITTGVGGLAITNNEEYAKLMRSYANHGRVPTFLGGVHGALSIGNPEIIANRFSFERIGYSSRCTEMEAALGLEQIERIEDIIKKRNSIRTSLIRGLYDLSKRGILYVGHPNANHASMMFPVVLLNGNRINLINYLEKNGVETRDMLPLINQPIYRGMIDRNEFPVSQYLIDNGFYIGSHQRMTGEDVKEIVDLFRRYFR